MARYVPILRWKQGEHIAVQNLSPAGRVNVTPLFILGGDRYVGKKATKNRAAIAAAPRVAADLTRFWGASLFYLDASAVPIGAAPRHPLVDIAIAARAAQLSLIPATRLAAPAPYQQAVLAVARRDGRGVMLRVDLQELNTAAAWTPNWPFALNETDLFIDVADNVGLVAALGAAVNHVFQNLHQANQWRSVTFGGTSMPENFAGYTAGLHVIPRQELALWRQIVGLGLPYNLDFGDYATIAVVPPPEGMRWGYPINVKYTLDDDFLICRGVRTVGPTAVDPDVQLLGHARSIAAYPNRAPLANCWGDARVDAIGAGAEGPSGLPHWVKISVNRHIELTRARLP